MAELEPELLDLWGGTDFSGREGFDHDGDEVHDYRPLTRGTLVVGTDGEYPLLLVRDRRQRSERQLWVFDKEGAVAYQSFQTWLASVTLAARADQVGELIACANAGDRRAGAELGKVRDPDALPILVASLEDSTLAVSPILEAIGRIGDDDAADVVGQFLGR